jgi:VWFA-related protein
MEKLFCGVVFLFLSTLVGFAQTPTPIPSPVNDNEDVVKISTTLIQIDVIVTDNDGKVVRDLKTEDFEIFENDEKQDITNFLFVPSDSGITTPAASKNDLIGKINVPPPSAQLRPEQVKRTIALIVDDLGLSFESVDAVRRSLRKFVNEQMQPNDLVGIIQTGSEGIMLQQFTSDKRQLYATIEKLRWNPSGRSGISTFAPIAPKPGEDALAADAFNNGGTSNPATGAGANPSMPGLSAKQKEQIETEIRQEERQGNIYTDFQQDLFTGGTLGAINNVVKDMSQLPGRKSIMLLSDGFQICPAANRDRCDRMLLTLKRLTDLANRSSISIYSFDARGLQETGFTAMDNTRAKTLSQLDQIGADRAEEIYSKQEGLSYLSKETGGRSYFNSNDISKNLTKALEDQKDYYLIGYQPQAESFDPKARRFNTLRVKVNRENVNVRYRSGFFGIEDSDIRASNLTAGEQMAKALTSPFPVDDINVHFNALFGGETKSGVLSLMHMNIKDLKFTDEQNGEKTAVFDFLVMSFGESGKPVDRISGNYTLSIKKEVYEKALNEGFVYNFIFPVKKFGAYHIKAAIRDTATGKIGSASQFIEVPNLKKKNLTLSGIVLENFTMAQWRQPANLDSPSEASVGKTNPLLDTSLRRFKRGTVLQYGVEIYNAKAENKQKPQLTTYVRLFHNGKTILNSNELPVKITEQSDFQKINSMNALRLGTGLASGDYILQIIVVDNAAKEKNKIATQSVQFEIIN